MIVRLLASKVNHQIKVSRSTGNNCTDNLSSPRCVKSYDEMRGKMNAYPLTLPWWDVDNGFRQVGCEPSTACA